MDRTRTIPVVEDGLIPVLRALAPVIRGHEAGRKSYRESGGHARHIVARTTEERVLLAWWKETCRMMGLDDDLRHW